MNFPKRKDDIGTMVERENEGRAINLYGMLCFIAEKWKKILICMIVVMILFSAGKFLKSWQEIKAKQTQVVEAENKSVGHFTSISEEQGAALIKTAVGYQHLIDETNEYLDHSVLMNLDNGMATSYFIQYNVVTSASRLSVEQQSYLLKAYTVMMLDDTVLHRISAALAPTYDVPAEYVSQLIALGTNAVESGADTLSSSTTVSETAAEEGAETETDPNKTPLMLQATITGTNEDFCQKVAEVIKPEMERCAEVISASLNHTIDLTMESSVTRARKDLTDDKKERYQILKSLTTDQTALLKDLNSAEKDYVMQCLSVNGVAVQQKDEQGTDEIVMEKPSFSVMYAFIGLLAGMVLCCGWYAVSYIHSGKVYVVKELKSNFRQPILGVVQKEPTEQQKKDPVVKFINKLGSHTETKLPKETVLGLAAQQIEMAMKDSANKQIGVTGVTDGAEVAGLCEELTALLKERGMETEPIGNILTDANAMKQATEVGGLVMIAELKVLKYATMESEMEFCRRQGIPVLGSVVLG